MAQVLLVFLCPPAAQAQDVPSPAPAGSGAPAAPVPQTLFDHPDNLAWYLGGQVNVIWQAHGSFTAPYSGDYSLQPAAESAASHVATLQAVVRLAHRTEVLVHVESTGGSGLSGAVGMAGFPNYDVVRNPSLTQKPYVARLMIHHVLALGPGTTASDRGPMGILPELPVRRLEVFAGKVCVGDFFDTNSGTGDSRFQFMNWTVDSTGAYDWAADTRGYTVGAVVQYVDRFWTLRGAEVLMPKTANGMDLDWDMRRARGENLELELRFRGIAGRNGVVRMLGYRNRGNMGSYLEAIDAFRAGSDAVPDIEASRRQGRIKYGGGVNVEQELSPALRVFARTGWNDGATESFAFTEVDGSALIGLDVRGTAWGRISDRAGVAYSVNGLSAAHREYLADGGHGFLLGDGRLTYGRERILEAYYTLPVTRGVYVAADLQYAANPGYNRDRGPVVIGALRLHAGL